VIHCCWWCTLLYVEGSVCEWVSLKSFFQGNFFSNYDSRCFTWGRDSSFPPSLAWHFRGKLYVYLTKNVRGLTIPADSQDIRQCACYSWWMYLKRVPCDSTVLCWHHHQRQQE
jgi:hypothetical protein